MTRKPFALMAAVALLMCASGCGGKHGVPDELLGTWHSDVSGPYKDASFEITATHITFRSGNGHVDRNIIKKVAPDKNGGNGYDIIYRNYSGGVQTLSVLLIRQDRGTYIKFRYQPKLIWRQRE